MSKRKQNRQRHTTEQEAVIRAAGTKPRPTAAYLIDMALLRRNPKAMKDFCGEWASVIEAVANMDWPFCILAGWSFKHPPHTTLARDADSVLAAVPLVNARMADLGSGTTVWVVAADEDLRQRASELLARLAETEGAA